VATLDELDEQLAGQLVEHARAQGTGLVGPDGLLGRLTKLVFETALEAEMSEHLGYEPHEAAGRNSGNSRNGVRPKTLTTEIGPIELEVPRDRNATFEPKLVRKRRRRLSGVDDMVCSLVAKDPHPPGGTRRHRPRQHR
jgi:transposase-like protein